MLVLYEKYGALSSERATLLLESEFTIKVSLRTVQRYVSELVEEKKLAVLPSKRREQIYALYKEEPSSISDFFLSKYWDALFEIRKELHNPKDQFSQSWDSFHKLRSLIQLLPENIKDHAVAETANFGVLDKKELENIRMEIGHQPILTVNGIPFGEDEYQRKVRAQELLGVALEKRVEEIIGRVSTLLHKELKESRIRKN
jgi:hypothetical protein